MTIRKKSPDTLKQQKNSFLNYIKHKEKYSEAIADLFLDDELEKIDDVESVKQHLEEKGISKELIDSLEADYQSYLRGQSFYGPEINFTEDTAESLKSNNKILKKLKNDIVKEYNLIKDFLALDIKKYVDEKFSSFNKKDFKNIGREISILDRDIYNLKREINSLNEYNSDEEQNIYLMNIKLNGLNIFQVSKKNKLKKSIEDSKQKVEENKLKIEELSEILNKKVKEYCKLKKLDNEINLNLTSFDRIKVLFGGKKRIDKKLCEISINEILSELSVYGDYIPERSIKTIESFITDSISLNLKEKKNSIIKMIKSYLNYFYFGEDRNRFNGDLNISLWGVLPTIYTDVKIDSKINGIINDLGGKININGERIIDRNFIDDVFIHTTGFNVLDEILNEGGLISTNEAQRRSKDFKYYNRETGINDIENSITQTINPHKDIYFSRGFRKNGYGKHESENSDDYVFIVNTMSNFANHGYGVPLNIDMQNNPGFATGDSSHDSRGYSIISKSALEDKQNGYSKIDMKDFYIFIPETKKREIEDNPKYKTNGANIIYFPENFKGRMSYELYEFIKNEIAIRDRDNDKKTPIPRKIVNSIDNISDISGAYEWAFCEKINDNKEYDFNPLDGSEDQLLTFLKNESTNNIAYSGISIDFNELKDFLSEQSLNIENLKATLNFPKELVTLVITCSKIGLGESGEGRGKRRISDICDKLGTFGYSSKEVGIVYNTIDWICEFKKFLANNDIKLINDLFKNRIKGWCNDWNVDYDKMAEFLKQSIIITRDKRMSDGLLNSVF